MKNADKLWDIVETHREAFVALANRVFDTPEVAYTEHQSCRDAYRNAGSGRCSHHP